MAGSDRAEAEAYVCYIYMRDGGLPLRLAMRSRAAAGALKEAMQLLRAHPGSCRALACNDRVTLWLGAAP